MSILKIEYQEIIVTYLMKFLKLLSLDIFENYPLLSRTNNCHEKDSMPKNLLNRQSLMLIIGFPHENDLFHHILQLIELFLS